MTRAPQPAPNQPSRDDVGKRVRFGMTARDFGQAEADYTNHERAAISLAGHAAIKQIRRGESTFAACVAAVMLVGLIAPMWIRYTAGREPSASESALGALVMLAMTALAIRLSSAITRHFAVPQRSLDAMLAAGLCPQCSRRLTRDGSNAGCTSCSLSWHGDHVAFATDHQASLRKPAVARVRHSTDAIRVKVPLAAAHWHGDERIDNDESLAIPEAIRDRAAHMLHSAGWSRWGVRSVIVVFAVSLLVPVLSPAMWKLVQNPWILGVFVALVMLLFSVPLLDRAPETIARLWVERGVCPCCEGRVVAAPAPLRSIRAVCVRCESDWNCAALQRAPHQRPDGTCPRCRYNLRGLGERTIRCPECALVVPADRTSSPLPENSD